MNLATPSHTTVLVTGGSGFLGSWVIVALLRAGFKVRATVRALSRENEARSGIATLVDPADRLAFFEADLLQDAGWSAAMEGCTYVMHVASPMGDGDYQGKDIITPAREGTRRVMAAAGRAGVRRVVLTSSAMAAMPAPGSAAPIHESVWTALPDEPLNQYPRSKALAEQDAWDAIADNPAGMELTTILPAFIQGPVMGRDYSASVAMVARMLKGEMPAVPHIGFSIVDVRDLADLHVRAMLAANAAGERILASGDFLWLREVAAVLREQLGADAARAPTQQIPDAVVLEMAKSNPQMAAIAPNLGVEREIDAGKAERLLGWKTRPAAQSIADAGRSLLDHGLV
jgi:dihydroflavonol-4-reductase